jgi:hemerythrin superfamily protein
LPGTRNALIRGMRTGLNALDLLQEQHDEVDALIERLQNETFEGQQKVLVFFELADKLAAHAAIEEQLFYPTVKARETEDILIESTFEHLAIKRVLADLMLTELDDPRFAAQLKVLGEEVEHHAREEEEGELFPKVRRLMSADELDALGGEMLALFEQLLLQQPRNHVKYETREAAKL